MLSNNKIKFFSLVGLFILTFLFASNGFKNFSQNKSAKNKINLGLDLVGGSSLTLEADFSQYIDDLNQTSANEIYQNSDKSNLKINEIHTNNRQITIKFDDSGVTQDLKEKKNTRKTLWGAI